MRNKIYTQCRRFSFFFFASIPLIVFSQPVAGDYRSILNGDWNMPSIWERFNGIVWGAAITPPSSADGVITITHVVTITSPTSADQAIIYNRLSVNSALTIDEGPGIDLDVHGTLDLSGLLNGDGSVHMGGLMNWTDNFLSVNITIATSSILMVSNSSNKTFNDNKTLLNLGTIHWTGGNIYFNGGTFINSHTFRATGNNSLIHIAGTNLFNNTSTGVISKLGTGTTSFGIPVTNAGTINVTSGTLQNSSFFTNNGSMVVTSASFTNVGDFINNGNMTMTSDATLTILTNGNGATLTNNAEMDISSSSASLTVINSGTVTNDVNIEMSSPSLTVINSEGGTIINNGDMDMGSAGTLTTISNSAGSTVIQNSDMNFTGSATLTNVGNWNLNTTQFLNIGITLNNYGNLNGSGTLVVNGSMTWVEGIISFNLTIAPGATLTVSSAAGSKKLYNGMTLLNQGTITWTGGNIQFNNAMLINENIITANTDNAFIHEANTNVFNNTATGVFTKTAGTGAATSFTVNMTVNNAGVININSGEILFVGTTTNTGTINAANGTTLHNTGVFTDNGTINIASATFNNSDGGIVTQNNLINFTNNVTIDNSSVWYVNVAQTLEAEITFNHSGYLRGTGSMVVNGLMNWTNNEVSINLTIASGATLTVSKPATCICNKKINSGKTVLNQGTMNWTGGQISFNAGTLINENIFTASNDYGFNHEANANLFNNTATGVFTRSSGAGATSLGIPVSNAGLINIYSGTVVFGNTTTHTGTINASPGTTLQNINDFTNNGTINISSAILDNSGGTFTQNNLISFTGTSIINNSTIWNVNVAQSLSPGVTLNHSGYLRGTGSITSNGLMNWTNNELAINLTIASGATLTVSSGGAKKINSNKTLLNQGTINWTGGNIEFNAGALTNENLITASSNNSFIHVANTNLFNNALSGVFTKSSSDATGFGIPVTSAGLIKGIGTIDFSGSLINNGTISPGLSPGILTINGNATLGSNSILNIELQDGTGPGTGHDQLQRAGNLTLAGTLSVSETGIVPVGSYSIISITSGTISGSFSTTNLPAGYSIAVNSTTVVLTKAALQTFYRDFDNDTYGDPAVSVQAASAPTGYVANNADCNDGSAGIHPGATEVCNGVDEDCDGLIDEGVKTTFYRDLDSDGYGDINNTTQACTAPIGFVASSTDCNDNNAAINPGATEVCNTLDDDCDGLIDEGVRTTFYRDFDSDGYGDINITTQACTAPIGFVANSTDCNDNNAAIHPGATEVCNTLDDDCDGLVDEGVKTTFYRDQDSDGYGNIISTSQACTAPAGFVANSIDCNDNNAAIHPGATEVCNAVDDDCDGLIDEGVKTTFYRDLDTDGYGDINNTTQACTVPTGYVTNNTDCNDNNASVHPGATELCTNSIDDDCDGLINEGCPTAVTIGIADVTVQESAGPALIPVTLSVVSASTVTVKYKTMNGTAQQRKDYTTIAGTLTFSPGQTSKNISVPVVADAIAEGNENFFIELSKPINATISDGNATITITETAPPSRIKSNPITEVTDIEERKLIVPNPQRKQERLRFFGVPVGSFDVMLIDINGKIVAKLKNYLNNWSMARLIPGIYFYQVQYKNQKGELIRRTGKLFIRE